MLSSLLENRLFHFHEEDLWIVSILAHLVARFFSAASLLECTMSKLIGRTGGTGIQRPAMDMVSQVRRTKD